MVVMVDKGAVVDQVALVALVQLQVPISRVMVAMVDGVAEVAEVAVVAVVVVDHQSCLRESALHQLFVRERYH